MDRECGVEKVSHQVLEEKSECMHRKPVCEKVMVISKCK